ncbi:MAG: hypothetical protein ACRD19_11035 [Terriglobia bacterium]
MVIPRPNPERLLKQVEAEEREKRRERLKIFLGYSSGVGKSYRMLDEGRRRKERGQDVVVGALQEKVTPDAAGALRHLEVLPVTLVDNVPMMNVPALLRRRPQICLVDGLAYNHPLGSSHAKRWQDVEQLLGAGISVITTVNLQHIEEYRDEVERLTGKRARDTVPMSFVNTADEIVVVDAPAAACLDRDNPPDLLSRPTDRDQQLSSLRELALLLVAEVVDRQLANYLERNGIEQTWGTQERILVVLTSGADAETLVASGQRNAQRFHGELYVAYPAAQSEDAAFDRLLREARSAGAHLEEIPTSGVLEFILDLANARGITQIFVGQSGGPRLRNWTYASLPDRLIRSVDGIDIQVFPK